MSKFIEEVPYRPRLDANGHELLDPTPVELPANFRVPETLEQRIARLVRSERAQADLDAAGLETFDEADDFEVGEDFDPSSPYETFFDHLSGRDIAPADFIKRAEEFRSNYPRIVRENMERAEAEEILAENLARLRKRTTRTSTPAAEPPKSGGDGGTPPSPSSSS